MKVKDICSYGVKSKVKAGDGLSEGKYNFYTSSAVCNKYLDDYQFEEPGIIMGTGGNATLHYSNGKFSVSTDCVTLFPDERLETKYLYYYFKSNMNILQAGFKGAGLKHTSKKYINEINIKNISSIQEQREVIGILEKIETILEHKKEQLNQYDTLIKSRFVELFGDPIENNKNFESIPGENVFKLSNGKTIPQNERKECGIPAYGGNGISWYTDNVLFEQDTIVVGRVGFQSGNVNLAKGPLWVTDNAMYISQILDENYELEFLYALMEHIDFTRYQDAGDLKKVTQKPFMQMKYIKPPISLQKEYLLFVHHVDKLKLEVQKSLAETQILFDSLMQKYFE